MGLDSGQVKSCSDEVKDLVQRSGMKVVGRQSSQV